MAELEEKLREAACFGDIDGVKELLAHGVNVNAQHEINGWTALHWAAKRNHLNIVNLLCNHGADKNIPTNKGEVAAQLTGEGVIKVLLNAMKGGGGGGQAAANNQASNGSPAPAKPTVKEEKLAITPNYIRNPPLAYQVQVPQSDDPGLEAALGSFEHLALDQDDGLRGGDPQLLLLQAHDQDTSQHDNSDKDMIFSAFSSDNIEELSANNKDITSSSFVSENIKDGSSIGMQELNIDYTLSDVKLADFSASFEYHTLMTNTAQALTARNSHVIKTAASFSGYENCIAANKALFLTKESLNVENSNSIVPSAPLNDDPNQPPLRGLGTIPSSYPYYTSSSEYSDLPSDCSADFSNEYLLETSSDSADYFLPFQLQPRQDINALAHNIPQRSLELSNRNLTHRHTCCDYSGKTISDQMIALTQTKQLDANDRLKIGQLLDYVHGSVNEVFPHASVECFGSCVNGLGSKTSDIDIHVDLDGQYNQDGTVINRNRKFELLQSLLQQEVIAGKCTHVEPVPNARVPVIKFQHAATRLQCDLSFKNRMGVLNSDFILAVTRSEPRFQPLFTTLKYLLKQQGLMGGNWDRLTSYALTLMVIFYFQAKETPILPPVSKIMNLKDPDLSHSINGWIFSFYHDKLASLVRSTSMDLETMLTGFFKFYSTFYYEFIICPYFGTELTRDTFRDRKFSGIDAKLEISYPKPAKHFRWCFDETGVFKRGLQVSSPMVVQDPFELNHNVTKNVDGLTLRYFKMFCSEALNVYSSVPSKVVSSSNNSTESSIFCTPKRKTKKRSKNESVHVQRKCLCEMFKISIYDKYYDEYLDRQQIPSLQGPWPALKAEAEGSAEPNLPRLTTSSNQLICYLCGTNQPAISFMSFHDLRSHLLDQHSLVARKYFFRPVQILETEKMENGKYRNSFGLLQNITCMNEFKSQSQEEIRLNVYNRKQLGFMGGK